MPNESELPPLEYVDPIIRAALRIAERWPNLGITTITERTTWVQPFSTADYIELAKVALG